MYRQFENVLSDPGRQQAMFEDLYRELKLLARSRMAGERTMATLNPTALVHEAWMRLEKGAGEPWRDRSQFFAAASEAMRRILVDAACKWVQVSHFNKTGLTMLALSTLDEPYKERCVINIPARFTT